MIRSFLNKYKKNSPESNAAQKITDAVNHFQSNPSAWDQQAMGNEDETGKRILNSLLLSIDKDQIKRKLFVRKMRLWSAAAAVVLLCLTIGLFRNTILDSFQTYPQVIAEANAASHKRITLPDGSVVVLNAGSRLSFPEHFAHTKREVTLLEGEAFFDIKHDEDKPFIVKSDKIKTTVLGTSFNIRSYRFIPEVTVTVSSGKVAVNNQSSKESKPYFLLPDQQVSYSKINGKMQTKNVKAKEILGWMDGKLSLANEDFKQVAGLLENKFNVKIQFDNPAFTTYHFTASFEAEESLKGILDDLTLTKGLSYRVEGRTIHIFQQP